MKVLVWVWQAAQIWLESQARPDLPRRPGLVRQPNDQIDPFWHSYLDWLPAVRRAEFEARPENKSSRDFALDLRRRLVECVDTLHPYHFQIGKYYDYHSALQSDAAWRALVKFKDTLDPSGMLNPGGLGLGGLTHRSAPSHLLDSAGCRTAFMPPRPERKAA